MLEQWLNNLSNLIFCLSTFQEPILDVSLSEATYHICAVIQSSVRSIMPKAPRRRITVSLHRVSAINFLTWSGRQNMDPTFHVTSLQSVMLRAGSDDGCDRARAEHSCETSWRWSLNSDVLKLSCKFIRLAQSCWCFRVEYEPSSSQGVLTGSVTNMVRVMDWWVSAS